MRMKVELEKAKIVRVVGTFEIFDAQSFAGACREIWMRLEQRCLAETANVGELMDVAGESVALELDGAELRFSSA